MPLTSLSPAPRGPLSSVTWDLPYGEPPSLDYAKAQFSNSTIVANLFDSLYESNPVTGTAEPDLATSFSRPNRLTLVYTIRRGVKFWDGHELTAQDVAYSLNRNTNPKVGSALEIWYRNVRSIAATGPFQVTIKLSHPDVLFPEELAANSGMVTEEAFAKAKGAAFGTPTGGVMGTGPYEFKSWTPGQQIVIQANPDYWNSAWRPKVHTIIFKFISDSSALISALLSGAVDGSFEVPPVGIPELKSSSVGHLYYGPSSETVLLIPLRDSGPMANPLIRKALSLAVNRSAIVQTVFNGAAQPLTSYLPPFTYTYAQSIFRSAYNALPGASPNLTEAKALVTQAGPVAKQTIHYGYLAGNQQELETGEILQSDASTIGLHLALQSITPTQQANLFDGSDQIPAGLDTLYTANYNLEREPLEEIPIMILQPPVGYVNFIHYNDPQVTALVDAAYAAESTTSRAQDIVAAQRIYQTQDTVVIPLVSPYEVSFANNRLTGFPTQFSYLTYPWATMLGATS